MRLQTSILAGAAALALASGTAALTAPAASATTWADTSVQVVQPPAAFIHYYSYGTAADNTPSNCITGSGILHASGPAPAAGHVNAWSLGTLPLSLPNLTVATNGAGDGVLTDLIDGPATGAVTAFVQDGYGDRASAVLAVSVSSGHVVTNAITTSSCVSMDTPANLAGGIQFTADDNSSPTQTITGWQSAGLPAGLTLSSSGVIGLGSAPPGTYSGVEVIALDGNILTTPSAATITFTLKVSAQKVLNAGSYGDEVNAFGNGFDVFRQHYAAGAIVAGWTATKGDPATNFIRISRGPGIWQFEAAKAGGVASGLCVSDPGGGWPDPAGPNGLLITPCNSGPWQQFKVLTAEPSELQNVATGLVVWPAGTGAQLRGSATPIPGVSNHYTWKDNNQLPG